MKAFWTEKTLSLLIGAVVITLSVMSLDFDLLEAGFYDFRMAVGFQRQASSDIVLVSVDDHSAQVLDEFSPLTLNHHVKFFEEIAKYEPRAVGYLIDLNRAHQLNPDLLSQGEGMKLISQVDQVEKQSIPVLFGTSYDVTGEVVPPFPLNKLPTAVSLVHKDGNIFSRDKVTRRALLRLNGKDVFHTAFAKKLGWMADGTELRGAYPVPEIGAEYFFFRYHGTPEKWPYSRISFLDVLQGRVSKDQLQGKVLLVGTFTKDDQTDFVLTPYSKHVATSPKLSVHASILDSIRKNDGIVRVPASVNGLVTFLMVSVVLWTVFYLSPMRGVVITLCLTLLFALFSQISFQTSGLWMRASQPFVGIFLSYYLAVPYRLILEYRKRWDYQRKNEILTQVEELKTNFLRLVTHDLKTPVARIQGLAEVLMHKAQDRLVERDKETLKSIVDSTEELNHFISSVLELTKIESNRLSLNLESKDMNQLLERAADRFKAPARAKGMKIQLDLDPLFPVRMDVGLMEKVINNLIDNAIKYSSPGSELRVQSREVGEWLIVSVTDCGIGLSHEEKEQLFTKFYRAKNDTTVKTIGSGLGLYLTKYFVEAHGGRVEVESEKGKGSTFRIFLPVEGASPGLVVAKSENESRGSAHV